MDRTHQTYFKDILRDVYDFGSSRITYHELYRWLDATRLGRNSWKAIWALWEEVLEEYGEDTKWRIGQIDGGRTDFITFVCLDPSDAKESHFKPLPEQPFSF